jgi:hypothetical protein
MRFIFPVVFVSGLLAFASAALADDPKIIAVSSMAEQSMDPDMLHLNVEVWSKAATGARAQNLAAGETKRILAVIEQYKVRKEEVQTQSYTFGPEYTWDNARNQNRLTGFRSTQTFRVTLKKVDQAGKFIDALTVAEKGGGGPRAESGTNVNNLNWDSSKKADAESSAVSEAVKMTRKKAEDMAKAAGVKIKGVQTLTHFVDSAGPLPIMRKNRGVMMSAEMARQETAVAEGQVKIQVTVMAEYEISN